MGGYPQASSRADIHDGVDCLKQDRIACVSAGVCVSGHLNRFERRYICKGSVLFSGISKVSTRSSLNHLMTFPEFLRMSGATTLRLCSSSEDESLHGHSNFK